MNQAVYSQLALATVRGSAHHLIKQHGDNRNEYGAWNAFREWYDGDSVKNKAVDSLKSKFEDYHLKSVSNTAQYKNNFLTSFRYLKNSLRNHFGKSYLNFVSSRVIKYPGFDMTVEIRKSKNDINLILHPENPGIK